MNGFLRIVRGLFKSEAQTEDTSQTEDTPQAFDALWVALQSTSELEPGHPDTAALHRLEAALEDVFDEAATLPGISAFVYKRALELMARHLDLPVDWLRVEFEKSLKNKFSMDVQASHWAVPVISGSLCDWLLDCGGENYISAWLKATRGGTQHDFELILRRAVGEPPSAKAARLEGENQELRCELEELRRELGFSQREAEDAD